MFAGKGLKSQHLIVFAGRGHLQEFESGQTRGKEVGVEEEKEANRDLHGQTDNKVVQQLAPTW